MLRTARALLHRARRAVLTPENQNRADPSVVRSGWGMLRGIMRAAKHKTAVIASKQEMPRGLSFSRIFLHAKKLGFQPGTVFDVGVANGTDWLYTAYPDAQYFLVEPVAEFVPAMEEIAKVLKAEIVLAAAGPEFSETVIKLYGQTFSSSTIIKTYGKKQTVGDAAEARVIPVIPLDSLLENREVPGPYLLKLDIQGAELLAIRGATKILEDTELIVMETNLFHFGGAPDLADVVAHMRTLGFAVYDILGGAYRGYDGALGQIDLVFAKEDGFFRGYKKWN